MSAKLFFKTVFLIAILFLLVLMGMHNKQMVEFAMPAWILPKVQKQPAAVMYFAFFAVGVLSGTILTAGGGGKKGGGNSGGKAGKSEK